MEKRPAAAGERAWWRAGMALAVLGGAEAVAQAVRGWRFVEHTDYVAFATAGRVLNAGSRCVYCLPTEARAEIGLLGHPPDNGVIPYANPPLAAELMRPVAALPLHTGAAVFLAILLLALAVAALLLSRLLPSLQLARRVLIAACAVTVAPGLAAFTYVQWDPLLVLAAAGAVVLLIRGDGLVAGAVLSIILVKPQLVWLVVPALLIAGHRRAVTGFLAGTAVWVASTLAIVGVGGIGEWYRSNVRMDVGDSGKTAGVPGLLVQLTGHPGIAFPAAVLCGLGAVALLWRLRFRLRADPALAVATGLALSLLAAPHAFGTDVLLLAPLVVLLARSRPEAAIAASAAFLVADLLQTASAGAAAHGLGLIVVGGTIAAAVARLPAPAGAVHVAPRTLVGSA